MSKKEKTDLESPCDFIVTTIAGTGKPGNKDGKQEAASFHRPIGVCATARVKGNVFYICDSFNNSIRKITNGEVTTLPLKPERDDEPLLRRPAGLTVDKSGDLYVADVENHRICLIRPDGTLKTLVGGFRVSDKANRLCGPHDVAEEKNGLVICDTFSHKIRFYEFEDGKISTIAGSSEGYSDGTGEEAKFSKPMGITVDTKGNIFVCDTFNYKIRKISSQGVVTTLAGSTKGHEDGPGKDAKFGKPTGIICTKNGYLFVTDNDPPCIRKISPTGHVNTITGRVMGNVDGPADKAKFYVLGSICLDSNEDLLVVDSYNHCIKKISEEEKE